MMDTRSLVTGARKWYSRYGGYRVVAGSVNFRIGGGVAMMIEQPVLQRTQRGSLPVLVAGVVVVLFAAGVVLTKGFFARSSAPETVAAPVEKVAPVTPIAASAAPVVIPAEPPAAAAAPVLETAPVVESAPAATTPAEPVAAPVDPAPAVPTPVTDAESTPAVVPATTDPTVPDPAAPAPDAGTTDPAGSVPEKTGPESMLQRQSLRMGALWHVESHEEAVL
jgi:hypothetical protein